MAHRNIRCQKRWLNSNDKGTRMLKLSPWEQKLMLQHGGMKKRTLCHGSGAKGSPKPRVSMKQTVEVLEMHAQNELAQTPKLA
jgi:hypothetical protein